MYAIIIYSLVSLSLLFLGKDRVCRASSEGLCLVYYKFASDNNYSSAGRQTWDQILEYLYSVILNTFFSACICVLEF